MEKVEEIVAYLEGQPSTYTPAAGWQDDPDVQDAHRVALARARQRIPPYPEGRFEGQGIVMVGGGRYWPSTYVSIRMLRHVGCELPVELYYFGHSHEMTAERIERLKPFGVTAIDLDGLRHQYPTRSHVGGWQAKPFAVLHSRFREVLYLDADCYPVVDPAYLFEHADYKSKGALFFPDCWPERLTPKAWEVFGLPYHDEPAFESGQFVLDKRAWWRPLNVCWWINDHSDFYYRWNGNTDPERWLYGDKDTFHLSAWIEDHPYAMWGDSPHLLPGAYLHHDDRGQALFLHRCRNKFRAGGEFTTTPQASAGVTTYQPEFPLEETAWIYFEELRNSESDLVRPDEGPIVETVPAVPRRPAHVRLCYPTLNRYDLLERSIASARAGTLPPDEVWVIDNGGHCPELPGVHLIRPGRNVGVAASWNWFLFHSHPGMALIANDDILFQPETIDRLYRAAEGAPHQLLFCSAEAGLYRWSCFLQRTESLLEVGPYDEEFWPAYYEDNDYEWRLRRCGGLAEVPGVYFEHQPGSTSHRLTPEQWATHNHHYAHGEAYYLRKWGGPPRSEQFRHPFNGQMGYREITGMCDFEALYDAVAERVRDGAILVEVGVFFGRSLCYLGQALRRRKRRVTLWGIDSAAGFAERVEAAGGVNPLSPHGQPAPRDLVQTVYGNMVRANLYLCGLDNVYLRVMDSEEAADYFRRSTVDFVFVDGAHDGDSVRADLAAWWPRLRVGGILAGHDYGHPDAPDVLPAVREFFGEDVRSELAPSCWQASKSRHYQEAMA